MRLKTLFATTAALLALLAVNAANADNLSLQWDPVSDERVTGYRILWGDVASGIPFPFSQNVEGRGTDTTTIEIVEPGTYRIVAISVSEPLGLVSDHSNEVTHTVEPPPLDVPANFRILFSATITVAVPKAPPVSE